MMKNDINLLLRRKTKTYSSKNILMLLLILLVIGAVAGAGIILPAGALQAAKIQAAEIKNELKSSAVDTKELANKTDQKARLDLQLTELNALKGLKADILNYIKVIESQRPTKIIIVQFITSNTSSTNNSTGSNNSFGNGPENTIQLLGVADSDKTIALFCLRLREQNVFKNVFLGNSLTQNGASSFVITLTLPSPLDGKTIIQNLEQKVNTTSNPATPGGK